MMFNGLIGQGATIDPFNESPWQYFLGLLREKQLQQQYGEVIVEELQNQYDRVTQINVDVNDNFVD